MEGEGKRISDSAVEQYHEVFPNDLNPMDSIYGGRVAYLVDAVAAMVARRHSGRVCVTASMDSIDFLSPVRKGEIIILKASVNRVWNSSCEVGVKVVTQDFKTSMARHVATAYLTFVALDDEGRPTIMFPVIPESADEKRRYKEASQRRRIRLARRKKRSL